MTSVNEPNVNLPQTTLYDATNHQVVAWEADETTVTTDNSVTPPVTYAKARISGSFSSSPPSDLSTTGTISAAQSGINTPVASATVVLALGTGQSTWKAMLKDGGGGFTSGTTLVVDKSPDGGTTWFSSSFKVNGASPNTPASSVVGPGPLELTGNAAGATHVRIRCSVLNSTETVVVRIDASQGVAEVGILAPLPAGTNKIGGVTAGSGDFADGSIVTIGQQSDSNSTNTMMGRLTKIRDIFLDMWDSTNHWLQVKVMNANANGQNTMVNSAPVVIASDQSKLPTKASANDIVDLASLLTKFNAALDGSGFLLTHQKLSGSDISSSNPMPASLWNGANQAAIDSAGNQAVKGGFAEQASLSAGALNADLVASTDVSAYKWFSLHINTSAYSGTLTTQGSNDGINWYAAPSQQNSTGIFSAYSSLTNAIISGPIFYRYLRIRMTSYTSGTAQATLELYTVAASLSSLNVAQAGTWDMVQIPTTGGGTTCYHVVSAASNNAANIKASAGQVYGWDIFNAAASTRYVKLFNKSSAPSPGTDTPVRTIAIPAGQKAFNVIENGMPFASGIGIAILGGIADSDNTSVSASDVVVDLDYK